MTLWLILVRFAVALLPTTDQERFLTEWRAEVATVRDHAGSFVAVNFAARLIPAAVRMNLITRADGESGYAELSVAILISVFPSTVLVGVAIYTRTWTVLLAELLIIGGIVLAASGFWSFEGRLLDSTRARVGLTLALIGSLVEVAVRRLTGFGPPIDEVVSAMIPHALILVGLALLVASSYAGQFRRRVQLLAICVVAPGAGLNSVVVIINGAALSGFDRFGVLMYLVPSLALAWASFAIAVRPRVFRETVTLDVS